ncbi:BRD4-interacting chromatin-remodeling complex-associated protein-like isoform X2 [Brienomyrus brachyistius]|uniref:BRD4-interacting chromatin-remodeling complex-associated protein-like isoform X2 n=1 Tax=Brienomyrus brachyistius TaxID=42636 RepID=UPI0020B3BF3E|nr:BRD4-interacting chromatin-remodeling complex-associated protein-like isoform X2 [Brienomyrus brachyistius]
MDDEDGRCLLDVICDPQALNDFLHGPETLLDTDDLLDCSADPSSSFFTSAGGHVPEIQQTNQLSTSVPAEVPSGSVDLDFLEDDDILGGSPAGGGHNGGMGTNNEPCDILQQSLAEANITEQSLQEAEELDLGSFVLPGLAQVVQTLPDPSLSGAGGGAVGVGIGVGVGGSSQMFPSSGSTATPPNAAQDMIGPVLAHSGLQLQPQGMNKTINVQPFMQQVTLQPLSSLQTLPNGSQSGHLGIGQIQVIGQPTVMTVNQSGQPILAKTIGSYQLQQPGPEAGVACTQGGLGGPVLGSAGGGSLLIQGSKATLGSPALNGAGIGVSSPSVSSSSNNSGPTFTSAGGLVGFSGATIGAGVAAQQKPLTQGAVMQNVVIQRTPTPIQPKPPQGGVIQPRLYKPQQQQQQQQQLSIASSLPNDSSKVVGVQQAQVPVSAGQNVAFLAGKPSANVVLSAPTPQGTSYPQALFKQQAPQATGKPLSVHLLNQSGSIVIPSQAVLQGQKQQFLLPQLQTGGQILAQHPGGHIITSQGPGGQLIANQILTTNQNLNLGQVLTSQGHSGTAHILSGHIQLQPGQMGPPALIHMPVSLAQTQSQAQQAAGHAAVIQGMPIQNSLAMLSQVEGLNPAVSLQPSQQQIVGGIPSNSSGAVATAQCQPTESVAVLGSTTDQAAHPVPPASLLTVPATASVPIPSSTLSASPSSSSTSSNASTLGPVVPQAQHSPGKLLLTQPASGVFVNHEPLQMFLHQIPSTGHHPQAKVLGASPLQPLLASAAPPSGRQSDTPSPAQAPPLVLSQQIQSPHHQPQTRPPSQPQPPSRSCTPSSLPPLFIIHNQISGSPQHASHTPPQLAGQSQPPSHPVPFLSEVPPPSGSPKPAPAQAVQFQSAAASGLETKQPTQLQSLTAEQQQTLQLVGAQLQALSAVAQPSPQQKQLLDRLQQVHQSILLKQQPQAQLLASSQFSPQQDMPAAQISTSSGVGNLTQIGPLLQSAPVLLKTSATVSSELQMFSGAPGMAEATVKQVVTPGSLNQLVQPKSGLISSFGGLPGTTGLQTQALCSGVSQLSSLQVPTSIKTQTSALKLPFAVQPSKEARMLEQLRRQQASVLHPDYSSPFKSFGDALHRLIPYHLYQGIPCSPQDNKKVDEEFEAVANQLLKRTQAMVDKYRLLLFEESKRLAPSAEMVMMDRMFIMEEKTALSQERVLAKERPDEYAALQSAAVAQRPAPTDPNPAGASKPVVGALKVAPAPTLSHVTPTKLVIKHGGGGASVSWSTSSTPAGCQSAAITPPSGRADEGDEDALPQRSKKPPMKTYEARRRIGLKLKIKQEAGLSKVVHNTALDPVHSQPRLHHASNPQSPTHHQQSKSAVATATSNRTPTCGSDSSALGVPTTAAAGAQHVALPSATNSSSSSSSSSSTQVNGTLEHHGKSGSQVAASSTPPPTSCRLPLRKTYRANISPPVRPGVAGGEAGGSARRHHCPPLPTESPVHHQQGSRSPHTRTVIASVKVENRGSRFQRSPNTKAGGQCGAGDGGGLGSVNAQGKVTPPGFIEELAEVEVVFNRSIKNQHRSRAPQGLRHSGGEEEERDGDRGRSIRSRELAFPADRLGSPSPTGSQGSWDSFVPSKRHKSDSPDMDNASFSSGSPPPDDSLNEHLQSAIDSILNLQQGPPPTCTGSSSNGSASVNAGRGQGSNQAHPSGSSYRAVGSSASPSVFQGMQGDGSGNFSSRGQNGKLVSRTYSR